MEQTIEITAVLSGDLQIEAVLVSSDLDVEGVI